MKLPTWASNENANIAIRTPETKDEMIKIILNKAAKPWYGMADPVNEHLPAVIEPAKRFEVLLEGGRGGDEENEGLIEGPLTRDDSV